MKIFVGKDKLLAKVVTALIGTLYYHEDNVDMDLGKFKIVVNTPIDEEYIYVFSPYGPILEDEVPSITLIELVTRLNIKIVNKPLLTAIINFYTFGISMNHDRSIEAVAVGMWLSLDNITEYDVFNSLQFPNKDVYTLDKIIRDGLIVTYHFLENHIVEKEVDAFTAFTLNILLGLDTSNEEDQTASVFYKNPDYKIPIDLTKLNKHHTVMEEEK